MKILLDTCVWGGARSDLVDAGHDVVWAGTWSEDPGDEEILAIANAEKRVLITLDKDFGELVIVRGISHSGILRLVNISAKRQGPLSASLLVRYEVQLRASAIITATESRVRIRVPDSTDE